MLLCDIYSKVTGLRMSFEYITTALGKNESALSLFPRLWL